MVDQLPIRAPAGYVTQHAVAFGSATGAAQPVNQTNPLPVAPTLGAAAVLPLTGTTATTTVVGPYAPQLGRPIWIVLSGNWSGSVALLRSTDGGATRLPATLGEAALVWTGNRSEPAVEESCAGATYYLSVSLNSGSLGYRMEQ